MFTKCVLSIMEVNLNQHLWDKKLVIICSRCPHNCKTAHFTSWKEPEGLWDVQKWKMHVQLMQNYQFSLSNMQICDVLSLSWMLSSQILNTVAKHNIKEQKKCWMLWKTMLDGNQLIKQCLKWWPNGCNMLNNSSLLDDVEPTCWIPLSRAFKIIVFHVNNYFNHE